MRRPEGPWFRSEKNTWYCTLGGRNVSLGVRGKQNRAAAVEAWVKLVRGEPPVRPAAPLTLGEVLAAYAASLPGQSLAESSRTNRRYPLAAVASATPSLLARPVAVLRAEDLLLASLAWGAAATRWNKLNLIRQAVRWAALSGLITPPPVEAAQLPPPRSRGVSVIVSCESHQRLLAHASRTMGDVLRLLWETGARSAEILQLTAAMVDLPAGVAMPVSHKTVRTGRRRVVHLTDAAAAVLRPRVLARPEGLLLPNSYGTAWTSSRFAETLKRVCERAGVQVMAVGYRHTFATRCLIAGIPDTVVAALLGHSSTTMIHRHYGHVSAHARALKDELRKLAG